jgi:hypothetical protein
MDGDGDGSSSSDVSSTAADEGPRADPELTQPNASPPTDVYSAEEAIALYELYDRTMLPHIVQSDPNMEADFFVFIVEPTPERTTTKSTAASPSAPSRHPARP